MHSIFRTGIFFLLFLCSKVVLSQTLINTSSVEGSWTKQNSPYIINTDIVVERGKSLQIEEGTRIEFNGAYGLSVNGILSAIGSQKDSIVFTSSVSTRFWEGIKIFRNYNQIDNDSIIFIYTRFENVHAQKNYFYEEEAYSSAILIHNYNRLKLYYCSFADNFSDENGGAITFIGGGGNTEIKFCRFINNKSLKNGGAIALFHSKPFIFSSLFSNNFSESSGGAIYTENDASTFESNIFKENRAVLDGGAICQRNGSSSKIRKNIFRSNISSNNGGALFIGFHSDSFLEKNRFVSNRAKMYGGAIHVDDFCFPLVITNNLILDNYAKYGGAISVFNAQVGIYANTIVKNEALSASGLYIASTPPVNLSCNILFYNVSPDSLQIKVKEATNPPFIDYSCIQNGTRGVFLSDDLADFKEIWPGIISSKPLFINILQNNYRLLPNSQCIDAGASLLDLITIPDFDLDENTRVQGAAIDIGAFEFAEK